MWIRNTRETRPYRIIVILISPKTSPSIVENITGENVTVNKNLNVCGEKARSPTSPQNPQPTAKQPRIDLDDAREISTFFDRTSELTTLENWILGRTRLISILGLRGSGKSAIALQLIQHIQYEFDCIIWRSLRDAPPLQTLQTDLQHFRMLWGTVAAISKPVFEMFRIN